MPLKISNSNPTKILRELIMNLKKSTIAIKDKNAGDLDNSKDYPTIADLIREQKVSKDESIMVHYRRDLDSLG